MADTSKASTFTRSGTAELGAKQTFKVTQKNTSYKHTLTFTFANTEYFIATKVQDTTIEWVLPMGIAYDMPNSTSGTGKFILTTYDSSGTKIGYNTLSFTFSIPDTVVPKINSVTFTEAEDIIKDLNLPADTFVNTLSRINYAISADGAYGSTIKSYSIMLGGVVCSGETGTTEVINETPQLWTVSVYVTDSRGRRGTLDVTYRVLEYEKPQIPLLVAERDKDNEAKINIQGLSTVSELNGENKYSVLLTYRISGSDDFKTAFQYNSPLKEEENETVFLTVIDQSVTPDNSTDNVYQFELVVSDKFSTVSRIIEVTSGTPVFDVHSDGTGMGFYQVAKPNEYGFNKPVAFYSGWKAKEIEASEAKPVDIDTILQAGVYHCTNTTNLRNRPYISTTNITASLMVLECGNAGQLAHIYTVCTKDGNLEYRRFRFYNSWGDWYRTSGEVILWQTDQNGTEGELGTGGLYMQESQTIELSEPISKQPNGIKLVFCRYYNETVENEQMQVFAVSKEVVAMHGATKINTTTGNTYASAVSHNFLLTSRGDFGLMAAKTLYIADKYITGYKNNNVSGTGSSGIKYNNAGYVLRYVIGY